VELARISGEVDWEPRTFYLPAGYSMVVWTYARSGAATEGLNAGWIDEIRYTPGGTAPLVLESPASQWAYAGSRVTFTQRAAGTPTLTYAWQREGQTLSSGSAATTLDLLAASPADAGRYRSIVANGYGAVTNDFDLAVHPVGSLPAPPRLLDAHFAETGCQLDLSVTPGWTFRVQSSTDLVHWQDRVNRFAIEALQSWTDEDASRNAQRFYRAVGP